MILRWLKTLFARDSNNSSLKAELSRDGGSVSFREEGRIMWLLVGLGNPGSKYADNRHNVGFMAIDKIANAAGLQGKFRKKFQGEFAEGNAFGTKILFLKPQTYMNLSGQSVLAAAQFYKVAPENIIVFHDEIDLEPSVVRVKIGGGNAGHNGLKSIQEQLGTPDYWRVRIGIGRSAFGAEVSDYVLSDFSKEEYVWLTPLLQILADEMKDLIAEQPKTYECKVNQNIKKKQALS